MNEEGKEWGKGDEDEEREDIEIYILVDLVDNNSKMVLGLLWRVITHYHIQV